MNQRGLVLTAAIATGLVMACSGGNTTRPTPGAGTATTTTTTSIPPTPMTFVLAGAGDIAQCDNDAGRHAVDTGRLLDVIAPDAVFTAGDNAYHFGSMQEFNTCYEPAWGRFKSKTYPAPGNHEYETPFAAPYFLYFGGRAGPSGLGYYSFTVGNWFVLSLNSVAPLAIGSEQLEWVRSELEMNRTTCALAIWHHPRFTSGPSGGGHFRDLWRVLQDFGVDVVINGHDHGYERFDPQTSEGAPDPNGMRQFTVGSGGASLYRFTGGARNSAFRLSAYGVLKLTLRMNNFDYAFIEAPTGGSAGITRDSASILSCH